MAKDWTMAMSPEELERYLKVLRAQGVREFQWGDFKVSLLPSDIPETRPREKTEAPKSMWQHPGLWGGGGPPKFPTNE